MRQSLGVFMRAAFWRVAVIYLWNQEGWVMEVAGRSKTGTRDRGER